MTNFIGTAGWSVPRVNAEDFSGDGTHLARYARRMRCVEINSSFYRPHRREVYERWAASTPEDFRFAVKLPKAISHEGRLRHAREPLTKFLNEASGLAEKLAVVLVQLPPSFAFEARVVRNFHGLLSELFEGAVVCEPRHASWFGDPADALLRSLQVGRVAADPARLPAAHPGGWLGPQGDGAGAVLYHRWHGSPRMYWSAYTEAWLQRRAAELARWPSAADVWTIFDNTAAGFALGDALKLEGLIEARQPMRVMTTLGGKNKTPES